MVAPGAPSVKLLVVPNKIPLAFTAGNEEVMAPFKKAAVCPIPLALLVTTTGAPILNSVAPISGVPLLRLPLISLFTTGITAPVLSNALTCGLKSLFALLTNNGSRLTVLASLLAGVVMAKSIAAIVAASVAFNKPMKPFVVFDKK